MLLRSEPRGQEGRCPAAALLRTSPTHPHISKTYPSAHSPRTKHHKHSHKPQTQAQPQAATASSKKAAPAAAASSKRASRERANSKRASAAAAASNKKAAAARTSVKVNSEAGADFGWEGNKTDRVSIERDIDREKSSRIERGGETST